MGLKAWWRELIGEGQPSPPAILSEREAIERIREYASAHNKRLHKPHLLRLYRTYVEPERADSATHWVYSYVLGNARPATFIEVKASDGAILAWRKGPR